MELVNYDALGVAVKSSLAQTSSKEEVIAVATFIKLFLKDGNPSGTSDSLFALDDAFHTYLLKEKTSMLYSETPAYICTSNIIDYLGLKLSCIFFHSLAF